MKKKVLLIMVGAMLAFTACGANKTEAPETDTTVPVESSEETTETTPAEGIEVSNNLFTLTLPAECKDTFDAEITDNQITIYHTESKDAGYGGMAFTVWARELPSEFAGGPYMKKGELTDADGKKYEVVLGYATEVQWDFEKSEEAPEAYSKLYDSAVDVVKNMQGINGATYEYGAGTKGENLYGNVLATYKTAVEENWDAAKYEENEMSPEFYSLAKDGGLEYIGFAYCDTDKDGIDELYVGSLKDDELKGVIYDIYTMVDGTPTHVLSGTARDRYYVYDEAFIINEFSGGANEYGSKVYGLEPNSTDITLQWATKYDANENPDQPWFIGYSDEEWENVTEEDFNNREATTDKYTKLDLKPLSELN